MRFSLPDSRTSGSLDLSQAAISMDARGPGFNMDASVLTSLPQFELFRGADTQVGGTTRRQGGLTRR